MAAHHHDFFGLLAPWNFAHHVGGIGVREHVRLHIQMHGDRFAGIRQALDERGIFERDGGGWNLRVGLGIIERAGVGGLHGERPDRSQQHGHGARFGRAGGARATIGHRLAISLIRHIEQHDLAGHLLAAEGVQRVEAGDGHDLGGDAVGRRSHAAAQPQHGKRMAEFGNTVGAVFNTITKSGANDFHGEGAYLFRRTDFSAKPKLLSSTALVPEVNVDSYSVDGGGRIIKDKLFFFGAFEHVKRDLPGVVSVSAANIAALGLPASYGDPIPFRQSVYFYMGKGDWQINAKNRLSMRYLHHANDSPYNNSTIGGQYLTSQSYAFVDRSHAGGVQLVSIVNDHIVNEFRMQVAYRGQHNDTFAGSGTGPVLTVSGIANFGGPTFGGLRVYEETTPEVADNFSYLRGSHSLKFGFSTH